MESSNSNSSNICRICFEVKSDTRSLFTKEDDHLHDKLVKVAKLNLTLNDGGPTSICTQCFDELNIFVNFLDKCKRANEIFLQFQHNLKDTSTFDSTNLFLNDHADGRNTNNDSDNKETCKQDDSEQSVNYQNVKEAPSKSALHTCQICCKVFTRKFNYTLHLKRHSGLRPWRCSCGAATLTRALALRHCATRARHACPQPACDKSFTSAANLHTHIRKHNGERPYECGECGKTFRSKNTLNDHIRIHTGAKPYLCAVCGQQFATNKLAEHARTHGARAHACGTCARRFGSACAVRRHARTHAPAAREHACAACPARYAHRQSLNKHRRKRHGIVPTVA